MMYHPECNLREAIVILLQLFFFFFQAEDGIRDSSVTGVQTCALPISTVNWNQAWAEGPMENGARRLSTWNCGGTNDARPNRSCSLLPTPCMSTSSQGCCPGAGCAGRSSANRGRSIITDSLVF